MEWFSSYPVEDLRRFISTMKQIMLLRLLVKDVSIRTFSTERSWHCGAIHALMLLNVSNLFMAKRLGHLRPSSKRLLTRANIIPGFCQKYILTHFEKLLVRFDVHPAEALELPCFLSVVTVSFARAKRALSFPGFPSNSSSTQNSIPGGQSLSTEISSADLRPC